MFDIEDRSEVLVDVKSDKNVFYLMMRDQRIHHNHCVNLGYEISEKNKTQFFVGCDLNRLKMNVRQKTFVVQGLMKLEKDAKKFHVNFYLVDDLKELIRKKNVDCIVLDYNPVREYLQWTDEIRKMGEKLKIRVVRVDAHNVIPCWKLDIYKRTPSSVRLQLNKRWDEYFEDMPELHAHRYNKFEKVTNDYPKITEGLFVHEGGFDTGMAEFDDFCAKKFKDYAAERNNTELNMISGLSPWVTFGQISPQKIIYLTYQRFGPKDKANVESFINEFFTWRELADHFVYHEKNYDNIDGALDWAKETLLQHKADKRKVKYSIDELKDGATTDALWNSAQKELVMCGKMHGYMRMYWCKSLLRWFDNPEDALAFSIDQNDTYSIDGNCSNGYLGCMWSICGSMDRAFGQREIFGKIRPMKNFKSPAYVSRFQNKSIKTFKKSFKL